MKKLTIVLLTVIVLLLASCSNENSSIYNGAEIISETAKQAGYMHFIESYDDETLGKYHVSYYPITSETEGASSIYALEFVANRGKYRNYYSLQELYNLSNRV